MTWRCRPGIRCEIAHRSTRDGGDHTSVAIVDGLQDREPMEERLRQDVEAWRWIDSSRGRFGRCRRGCPDPNRSRGSATSEHGDSRNGPSGAIPNPPSIPAVNRLLSAMCRPSGPDTNFSPLLFSRTAPCGLAQRTLGAARRPNGLVLHAPHRGNPGAGSRTRLVVFWCLRRGVLGLGSQTSP